MKAWAWLLDQSTLPENVPCTDNRVLDKIRALDNLIRHPESQMMSRLAYVQLTQMLAALRRKINDDRKKGLIVGKRSRRDATEAVDIYLHATGRANRGDVCRLTCQANRWAAFAGRYPLLLITLTDKAEKIMYVCS